MKVKALTGFEAGYPSIEDDEDGNPVVRIVPVSMKEGEIADIDDKLAKRLLGHGHVSEDLEAETNLDRVRREAARKQA